MPVLQHYDQVVSLGRGCQPAHQIRRILQSSSANIFDWIVTTDEGLVAHIESGLDGFFERDSLAAGSEGFIVDRATGTQFQHEFPKDADFDAQYEASKGRFIMLAQRWRELLASEQDVLFVRQHGWDADVRASAVRLRETIRRCAPRLHFTLLYLTKDAAGAPWGEAQILNRYLTQPDPYDWKGDDAAWSRLLEEALALPPSGPVR
jgi:hypothetical protein